MKPYLTLYWKEIKFISGLGLLLLAITFGGAIYLSIADCFKFYNRFLNGEMVLFSQKSLMYAGILVYASIFMLPIILVYSLNIERKSKTHYLLLSLPVSKRHIIFNKFLAVMSFGMILAFIFEFMTSAHRITDPISSWVFYKNADEDFLKYYARGNTYIFQKLLEVKQNLVFPYQKVLDGVVFNIRQFS